MLESKPVGLVVLLILVLSGCLGGEAEQGRAATAKQGLTLDPGCVADPVQSDTEICSCGTSGPQADQCLLFIQRPDANTNIYTIQKPVVDQQATLGFTYPLVIFQPGDRLTFSADGCVQTGGFGGDIGGGTWKLYVDPQPPEGQYFGTVYVNHAQVTISTFDESTLTFSTATEAVNGLSIGEVATLATGPVIVTGNDGPSTLRLGYKDDNPNDNGYYSHDDGDNGQCAAPEGNAIVRIVAVHGAITAGSPLSLLPYDLTENFATPSDDSNGLYLNPIWGWQFDQQPEGSPASIFSDPIGDASTETSEATFYNPSPYLGVESSVFGFCHSDVGNGGHLNWQEATFTGKLFFDGRSCSDDDYNLRIEGAPAFPCTSAQCNAPNYAPAITSANDPAPDGRTALRIEFNANETVDNFDQDPTWKAWHQAEDDGVGPCTSPLDATRETPAADAMVNGHDSVVVGIVGLDEGHFPFGAEVHPAHAFAVDMSCTAGQQQWMFFVRNNGNEGFCSSVDVGFENVDALGNHELVLDLPRPEGASSTLVPSLVSQSVFSNNTDISIHRDGSGPTQLLVTFHSPAEPIPPATFIPVQDRAFAFGTVTLGWDTTTTPAQCSTPGAKPSRHPHYEPGGDSSGDGDSGENIFLFSGSNLTAAQAEDYENLVAVADPNYSQRAMSQQAQLTDVADPIILPTPVTHSNPTALSSETIDHEFAEWTGLCIEGSGQLPLVPGACTHFPPLTLSTVDGTPGKNGWVVSSASLTLTARDASGSGIDHTEYSSDGLLWERYSGSIPLQDGSTSLYYRSIDTNGNIEKARSTTAKVDTLAPHSEVTIFPTGSGLMVTFEITDPAPGSGAAGLKYKGNAPGSTLSGFVPGTSGVFSVDTSCTDVDFWAVDNAGNEESAHHSSPDVSPPSLSVSPADLCLWPPNHKSLTFDLDRDLSVSTSDACDPSPRVEVVALTSNEPVSAGDMSFGPSSICVSEERLGRGTSRTYTATIRATDYAGNSSTSQVNMIVPHDMSGATCQSSNSVQASEQPCP